ncbi:MAG: hypothetical protein IH623_26290 [Verrucomicrobia bacterium]|nr:hypothetical protein [Verrucomicrobiota bacterium]
MSGELDGILESKRAFRQRLATRPIEDQPALLDALRKRALAPREARPGAAAGRISAFGDAARRQEKS